MAPHPWLAALLTSACGLLFAQGHELTSLGSPMTMSIAGSEREREAVFRSMYGEWPIRERYPGALPATDTAEWLRRMDEREDAIRSHPDGQQQWDLWLDHAQMRALKSYTSTGHQVARLDPDLHAEIVASFKATQDDVTPENNEDDNDYQGMREIWQLRDHIPESLHQRLIDEIQRAISDWMGIDDQDLDFTSIYGARVYREHSVLADHIDIVDTHVLSAVYCIAIEGEKEGHEPWYLVAAPDFTGNDARVDLRPGQLWLYESAKLPHARPEPFQGDKYVAVFVHFRPRGWDLQKWDVMYWVPPGWEQKVRQEL